MSATARVHTGSLRARGTTSARSSATARSTARTASRPTARTAARPGTTRRTGPVHVRPQLRLVTEPVGAAPRVRRTTRTRPRRTPFVLLMVGLIAVTALVLLALNTAIAVDSLRASEQRAANTELSRAVERLEQQVTTARTPAQLAAAAAAAGLVPAGTAGHLVLGPDGTSVLRGAPEPAPAPEPPPAPEPAPAPGAAAPSTPEAAAPSSEQAGG
ncbi:hypothetical protein [Klenkia taihuensis]|uniref:Cell division protein FtsL n=1 Tax=Klenkia taihuensis TaxID=1225127 RepID=A0A1I1SZB0_9ACTN|nr:hypothetical protein [Klenkia taihuensis]GHE13103.1 hypothetical protein GCM10011381_33750 [Klenkia taihuensis]SFD51746.1 hypothetical protein SAMN05661030_3597 [Klenkia taihuensis]